MKVEIRKTGQDVVIRKNRPSAGKPSEFNGNNGIGEMEIEKTFIVR